MPLTLSHPQNWLGAGRGCSCAACGGAALPPPTQQQLPAPLHLAVPTPGPQMPSHQSLPAAWTPCCQTHRGVLCQHAPTGLMTQLHQTMLGRPCMAQAHMSPSIITQWGHCNPWPVLVMVWWVDAVTEMVEVLGRAGVFPCMRVQQLLNGRRARECTQH